MTGPDRIVGALILGILCVVAVIGSPDLVRADRAFASAPQDAGRYAILAGAGLAIAIGWALLVRRHRHGGSVAWLHLSLAAWILSALVGASAPLTSPYWLYFVAPYLGFAIVFLLADRIGDEAIARWIAATVGTLVAVAILLDAFGFPQYALRRPSGFLGNRNFAGELVALAIPAAVIAFSSTRRRWPLLLLPLLGLALAWTRCRTAWIAIAAAAPLLILLSDAAARRARMLGVGCVLAGALLAGVVPHRLDWGEPHPFRSSLSRIVTLGKGSGRLRVKQYALTRKVLSERGAWMRGLGPGGWQSGVGLKEPTIARNRVPHGELLRAVSDGGILCLVGLIVALASAAIAGWSRRRDAPDAIAFVAVLAIICLADAPMFRAEVAVLAAMVLAAIRR